MRRYRSIRLNGKISVAHAYCYTVLKSYPTLSDRSELDARIVLNPVFESNLVRILNEYVKDLRKAEREGVVTLSLRSEATVKSYRVITPIVERVEKRPDSE